MPHASLSLLALLFAATEAEPEAVPIQRPTELGEPAPTTEPAPATVAEPEPTPGTVIEPEPAPGTVTGPAPVSPEASEPTLTLAPEPATTAGGVIEGVLTDSEIEGVAMMGVRIEVHCTCLDEPLITSTDVDGHYRVEGLPPGVFTVFGDRGGPATERVVALAPGQATRLDFRVAPPTDTAELDRRRDEATRAQTLMSIGGVSAIGGVLLLIGAAVENAKRDCLFGQDECAAAPRPQVTRGLAVTGALFTAGGAALVGLGVHKHRRLRASISADDRSAALVISGRF